MLRCRLLVLPLAIIAIAYVASTVGPADATHTCFPNVDGNGDTLLDADGDGLPDTCDPSDLFADFDADSFKDSAEIFIGTDPVDACSFPPDVDNNGSVNIIDVFALSPPVFNSTADDENYNPRVDLDANEVVNILDVLTLRTWFNESSCPFSFSPVSTVVPLRQENRHFLEAKVWFSDIGAIHVAQVTGIPTCEEVRQDAHHWTNLTSFTFLMDPTAPGCAATSDVRVLIQWSALPKEETLATVNPFASDPGFRECTGSNPCHFAELAQVLLNSNNVLMSDPEVRHMTITHELGHVVGGTHPEVVPQCPAPPWTIMWGDGDCLLDHDVHWPRPDDVLFTNIKY